MALKARRATAALPRDVWTAKIGVYCFLTKFIVVKLKLSQKGLVGVFEGLVSAVVSTVHLKITNTIMLNI